MGDKRLVAVGRIQKARGLRGELKMEPLSNVANRFDELGNVVVEFADGSTEDHTVEYARSFGQLIRLKLIGIDDRNAADRFRGVYVLVHMEDTADLDNDTYYIFDLEGLTVFDSTGKEIGTVKRIESCPANDILVIDSSIGEIMMPAIKEYILDIDLERKRMTVDLREGLPSSSDYGAAK